MSLIRFVLTWAQVRRLHGLFTSCRCERVYAIDVGYGLLDWRLRQDNRVVNLERTQGISPRHIPESIDVLVADISFNSLTRILTPVMSFLRSGSALMLLIKPQFEAEDEVGQGLSQTRSFMSGSVLKSVAILKASARVRVKPFPILGGHGNKEF